MSSESAQQVFTKRVIVVENDVLLCDLIARMLEQHRFSVLTAHNAVDAQRLIATTDPDALVLDIDLGLGPNGFDLANMVRAENPERGIVFLTNLPDPRFVAGGADAMNPRSAYLRKSQLIASTDLVDALDAVLRDQIGSDFRHDLLGSRPLAKLSSTQIHVLTLVARGKSNSQIAEARGTSVRAVEAVISRIFSLLGIDPSTEGNPRVEAARAYFEATGQASS